MASMLSRASFYDLPLNYDKRFERERGGKMLEYKSHKSGRMGMLIFDGALDETCYKNMESILMMAVINENTISLDFTDVTCVDLNCFKLLCMTHRTTCILNKHFQVFGAKKEVFMTALSDPRYSRHVHCVLKDNGGCFFENGGCEKLISVPDKGRLNIDHEGKKLNS